MVQPPDLDKDDLKTFATAMKDGHVTNIEVTAYSRYVFTITFKTDKHSWQVECGGDAENIWDFDPFGGWQQWNEARIRTFTCMDDFF